MVASVGQPRTLTAPLDRPLSPPLSTSHQLFPSPSTSSSDDDGENEQKFNNDHLHLLPIPEPSVHDPLGVNTADGWIERHPSLIRLTGKQPFNSEPPLSLLMSHGFITPVPIHYVRNHGAVPGRFADWFTWTVEICGLVNQPGCFTVAELVREFPSFEIPVTLVCAGNRRKEQNMVQQTIGFNWGPAAIATSVWRGVRLRDVLRRCGALGRRGGALNVCFEGAEDLPGGGGGGVKYGTSLKMEVAMDPSRDIMIAYMQNGEVLTPDHGFPCRMIIPGFIGGRMVKWLKRIMVTTSESENYYHYKDNRVLPSHVDAELADAEGWWYKPEHLINELNINSVITMPGHNETVQINSTTTPATYALRGYAYTGGGKKVTRVEISLDSGDTWRVCAINHNEKPNKYGKYWCWCFWSLHLDPLHLLAAEDISVRAWDETHNTQPRGLIWNLMGMMNNCWFRVRITARKSLSGDATLTFEHPTQPGNLAGGWMPRHRQQISSGEIQKNVSTPFINNMPTSPTISNAYFSFSDVRKHSSPNSVWIVVHENVYDCTSFLKDHPGGADSILINAGTDCSDDFDAIHSEKAKLMLANYHIGHLNTTALTKPVEKVLVKLVSKTQITDDVRLFRFALPAADQQLGLRPGKHVFLTATVNGKPCMRAYTPTSREDAAGYVELLIRIYADGVLTQHLDLLPLGEAVEIKGPVGRIEYAGAGSFVVDGKQRNAKQVVMVAGGTGITPIYQVIRAAMKEERGDERLDMHLVYASRSEDDILLRKELDDWTTERPERLKVWYVVGKVRRKEEWGYSVGRVTEGVLTEHIPNGGEEESLALVCGPPAMIKQVVLPALKKLKYEVGKTCFIF